MSSPPNNKGPIQESFPEIDFFILWLLQRAQFEITEEQLVFLTDRFLNGGKIMMVSDKNVILVVNGVEWDWKDLLKGAKESGGEEKA